jgi:hypothetical protein
MSLHCSGVDRSDPVNELVSSQQILIIMKHLTGEFDILVNNPKRRDLPVILRLKEISQGGK